MHQFLDFVIVLSNCVSIGGMDVVFGSTKYGICPIGSPSFYAEILPSPQASQ